ncbi:MAG TPA: hypothetical protein VF867_20040 [Arthrobacter sp.]
MNYFLELTLSDMEGTVLIRPEHVSAIELIDDEIIVRLSNGVAYCVEPHQFVPNKLINRTSHAGMRVL